MDPTILGALAGVIGGVIGAMIGGFFALRAATKQIEVMLAQTRGSVNERLYNQNLEINRFFAENPELRPYFSNNKELTDASAEEKLRVLSTAEMLAGFVELVALQMPEIEDSIQLKWKNYIVDAYNSSPALRQHFEADAGWYADDILALLPKPKRFAD